MTATTTQIEPGVHRVADGLVNWYLIEDGDGLTLVDAGWPRSWPRIERAVSALGGSTGDIELVEAGEDKIEQADFVMIREGRVSFEGTAGELRNSKDPYLQKFLS